MTLSVVCLLGLACSWYMTGIVWFAQLVHYPLLDRGDREDFARFAAQYQRRTLWVVTPALAGEAATSVALVALWPSLQSWLALAAWGAVWALTLACQIPQHLRLRRGYDAQVHRSLVRHNAARAVAWTLRAGIMAWAAATMPA